MKLLIVLFALLCMSPWAGDAPDCNHGQPCDHPAVCTFLPNLPGGTTGEWACVASVSSEPDDPRHPHGPRKRKK